MTTANEPPASRNPDPDRTRAEGERLAAETRLMAARLGPGDGPDLRDVIATATRHA